MCALARDLAFCSVTQNEQFSRAIFCLIASCERLVKGNLFPCRSEVLSLFPNTRVHAGNPFRNKYTVTTFWVENEKWQLVKSKWKKHLGGKQTQHFVCLQGVRNVKSQQVTILFSLKKVRKKTCKSESWSTHTIPTLMNLQRQRRCPRDELAAECELPPRGKGANKTQHNTNKPAQLVRASQPASRSASRPGWQQSLIWYNEEAFVAQCRNVQQQSPQICTFIQLGLLPAG